MALLRGCAWQETRYYSIMALEEAQLVRIMCLPGSHKTSVAFYALMEHQISPAIRLIERPTINTPKFISSWDQKPESATQMQAQQHSEMVNKIYSIQNHPQIYREKP